MTGAVAYPRKNGEPVFDAPWQSRAFGMVVDLHTAGLFAWDEFKALLIEEVAAGSDDAGMIDAETADAEIYYRQWMSAFQRLLFAKGIISKAALSERAHDFQHGVREDVY